MLLKCYPHYVSKFGKLSSGHRTGKGQFSFQSPRKATPKNIQTAARLCSFHMMYSVDKLNKQDDNIQSCHNPFTVSNQSVVPWKVLTVVSWSEYRFLRRQVRWSGIPISLRMFHSLLWSTLHAWLCIRVVQWGSSRCFSGIFLFFWWSKGCWLFDLCFLYLF